MDRFPMGFWNYCTTEEAKCCFVKDWDDAGMTLTLSPEFDSQKDNIDIIKKTLDDAQRYGIRIILCDKRSHWRTLTEEGEEKYRNGMMQAIKYFGNHPAIFGFHVGDEPDVNEFEDCCKAIRIQKEVGPKLIPFCNLLPWHKNCETRVGFQKWADYLDAYIEKAKPPFLCYDCYSQMLPGTEGFEMYFINLREYGAAARRHNLTFWTTLLSVGHFRYRCPKEDDLRWQLNTALAHGAKGLLWFFFYMRKPHENYRVAPVDEHWERTETFEWLSRINRTFLKTIAPVMNNLTLKNVTHFGKVWGGFKEFDGSGLVKSLSSSHTPLIVSEFIHTDGKEYIAVTNNSQTDSTSVKIQVKGKKLYQTGWMGKEEPVIRGDGWEATSTGDYVEIRPWLCPGQMAVYRVENE